MLIVNVIEILILLEKMGAWRASLAMAVNGLKLLYRFDRSVVARRRSLNRGISLKTTEKKGQKAGLFLPRFAPAFLPCSANGICINSRPPWPPSLSVPMPFLEIVGMADDVFSVG